MATCFHRTTFWLTRFSTLMLLVGALAFAVGCSGGGVGGFGDPGNTNTGGGGGNTNNGGGGGGNNNNGGGNGGGGNGNGTSVATGGSGGATGQSTGNYNGRAYSVYVPTSYNPATPTAVVVLCHDSATTYSAFFTTSLQVGWQAAANAEGFIVMVPDDANSAANSFVHTSGANLDLAATRNDASTLLDAVYYAVGNDFNVETTEIYMVGFGDGAAFADIAGWSFSTRIAGIACYGGGVGGKTFPVARDIPAWFQCGSTDSQLANIQSAFGEWTAAGHDSNSDWVNGVGHNWSQLNQTGSSPTTVYQWLIVAAAAAADVTSTFDPDQLGGGNGGGGNGDEGSGGSGGQYPGTVDRTVAVPGYGNVTSRLYIPSSYNPANPMPLIICLHGQAGDGNAPTAAAQVRSIWQSVAEANGFIVCAQQGLSAGGSYSLNEAAVVMNELIDDAWAAYNVAVKKNYLWGFSAGGHITHAIALANADFFAAYGVSAGVLGGAATPAGITPASASRKLGICVSIGTTDPLNPNTVQDRTAFLNAGWVENTNYLRSEFAGGHTFNSSTATTIWNFIKGFQAP
ncbi:MAG: hypothetical protein AB7K09_12700 [Planctomycetota bacterium]